MRLQILAKSLSGEEVARELISVLSVNFGVSPNQLLAVMCDRASVNEVALKTVKIVYPYCLSVGCFSHTIDHVGDREGNGQFQCNPMVEQVGDHGANFSAVWRH